MCGDVESMDESRVLMSSSTAGLDPCVVLWLKPTFPFVLVLFTSEWLESSENLLLKRSTLKMVIEGLSSLKLMTGTDQNLVHGTMKAGLVIDDDGRTRKNNYCYY